MTTPAVVPMHPLWSSSAAWNEFLEGRFIDNVEAREPLPYSPFKGPGEPYTDHPFYGRWHVYVDTLSTLMSHVQAVAETPEIEDPQGMAKNLNAVLTRPEAPEGYETREEAMKEYHLIQEYLAFWRGRPAAPQT